MRAVTFAKYGLADELRTGDRPVPNVESDGVLIRVVAAGVNPADWRLRNGQFKRFMKLSLPFVPGNDVAGTVAQIGSRVSSVRVGDAVFAMTPIRAGGACAQYVALSESLVALAPLAIPLADAAALPLAGLTALQGLRDHAKLREGQTLLVVGGSGGVGHYAVQIGKAFGASVTALCGKRNFEFVRGLGADHVMDYTDTNGIAGLAPFDVVFDTVALERFTRWRHQLRTGGTLVTVNPVIGKMLPSLLSRTLGISHLCSFFVEPGREGLLALRSLVDAGRLRPSIDARFAFECAGEAYRLSEDGHVRGKLVIDVS